MPRRTPGAAMLAGLAAAATILAGAGCTSSADPSPAPSNEETSVTTPTPTSSGPTGTGAGAACGFVPAAALADVLGTTRYETAGSLTGTEPARTGACSVIAPDNDAPAIQATVGPGSTSLAGASAASVRAQVDKHPSNWFIYPTSEGVGWAHPQYESTVDGTKVTGALSYLVRGRDVVGVRLLRPRPGRDAVRDAVSLATAVAEELGLPVR